MQCAQCGSMAEPGQGFCGSCGAPLPSAQPEAGKVVPPPTAPTSPVESPVTPAPDAQAAYEAEYAKYQEEYAAWQAGQAQPAAPSYPAAYPAPASPLGAQPKKSKTGLIVGLVIGGIVLLVLVVVALGVLGVMRFAPVRESGPELIEESSIEVAEPAGFASAEEALIAVLPEYGSDWVYKVYEESDTAVVYWIGPPASEFVAALTATKADDGSWTVTAEEPLDFASDVGVNESGAPIDQAMAVVTDHLIAVMEDRAMDAQSYTVEPFSNDPASAQYSNGDFKDFTVESAKEQSDGSFWVKTIQKWSWGSEKWQYWVVPTEAGFRIAELKEW